MMIHKECAQYKFKEWDSRKYVAASEAEMTMLRIELKHVKTGNKRQRGELVKLGETDSGIKSELTKCIAEKKQHKQQILLLDDRNKQNERQWVDHRTRAVNNAKWYAGKNEQQKIKQT